MNEEVQDAQAESSPATEVATDQMQQGAPPDSPTGTGGKTDSPTAADELAEFKADVAKATGQKPADAESETTPKANGAKPTEEPAKADGAEKDPDALSQENQDKTVPKNIDQQPEWQAAIAIADKLGKAAGKEMRGIMRGMFKQRLELSEQVERFKPAVEVVEEMRKSVGGSEQGFTNMRHLIKSYDSDPAAAVPMLKMLLEDAEKRAGLVLQSPELLTEAKQIDEAVKSGAMDEDAGEKRKKELLELEQHRAGSKRTQQALDGEAQRKIREAAEQQEQRATEELNQTETRWVADKAKSDPDFEAVKTLHGKFTQLNVAAFADKNRRWPNVKEAIDLLETSYKEAKAEALKFRPKPQARQVVTSGEGSSGNNRQQPMSELDEFKQDVQQSLKRHGR